MNDTGDAGDIAGRVVQLEGLLEALDSLPDTAARARAVAAVEAIVELYGDGLARIMARLAESSDPDVAGTVAGDELVGHLLLVHDLHPVDLERRITQGLEAAGPHLGGGRPELLGVDGGVARVRVAGGAGGCGAASVEATVRTAVFELAPDLDAVEVVAAAEVTAVPVSIGPRPETRLAFDGRSASGASG